MEELFGFNPQRLCSHDQITHFDLASAGPAHKRRAIPDQVKSDIEALLRRLRIAYCTGTAIALALRGGLEDADEDVGLCMQEHVVEELCQIGEQPDLILLELGGKPQFMPMAEVQ